MAMFEGGSNSLIFVYNSKKDLDKKALAYLSVYSDKIAKFDIDIVLPDHEFLKDLASKLGVGYEALADHECDQLKNQEYYLHLKEPNQYVELLVRHPEYIKTPVIICGDKAHYVTSESDLLQLSFL